MKTTIQLSSDCLKHTASSGYLYQNLINTGNPDIRVTTKSGGLFFVVSQAAQQAKTSKDIDDFIGDLLAQDPTLENDLHQARQWVADVLYEDQADSLKKLRLRAGYSQTQLAKKIKMKQPNICEFEAGKRKPNADTLKKLADALGTTADAVLRSISKPE